MVNDAQRQRQRQRQRPAYPPVVVGDIGGRQLQLHHSIRAAVLGLEGDVSVQGTPLGQAALGGGQQARAQQGALVGVDAKLHGRGNQQVCMLHRGGGGRGSQQGVSCVCACRTVRAAQAATAARQQSGNASSGWWQLPGRALRGATGCGRALAAHHLPAQGQVEGLGVAGHRHLSAAQKALQQAVRGRRQQRCHVDS